MNRNANLFLIAIERNNSNLSVPILCNKVCLDEIKNIWGKNCYKYIQIGYKMYDLNKVFLKLAKRINKCIHHQNEKTWILIGKHAGIYKKQNAIEELNSFLQPYTIQTTSSDLFKQ